MFDELAHLAEALAHARRPHAALARRDRVARRAAVVGARRRRVSAERPRRRARRCAAGDDHRRAVHARRAAARRHRRGGAAHHHADRARGKDSRDGRLHRLGARHRHHDDARARRLRLQRVARRRGAAGRGDRDLDRRRRHAHGRSARRPGAQLIERIAFDEASELASFGAKVLHPNTIAPAVMRGIPVWVLNSRRPGRHGHAHHLRRAASRGDARSPGRAASRS